MMSECELLLGRHDEARALVREAFPAITELSDATMEVHALRIVGMLAAASGQAENCAALFGASDRMLEDSEVRVFTDHELALHGSYLGRAHDALEELVFAAAYERGHEAPATRSCCSRCRPWSDVPRASAGQRRWARQT